MPGHPITVWRPLINAPTYDFESGLEGFVNASSNGVNTVLWQTTGNYLYPATNGHALRVDVTANGAGNMVVKLPNPGKVVAGKKMILFFKNLVGTNWSYAQAFVQDGPAKGYRWASSGYARSQIGFDFYTSMVVPVPADYSASGGGIGLMVNMTGAGSASFMLDAITFSD